LIKNLVLSIKRRVQEIFSFDWNHSSVMIAFLLQV
jgi:hypothetical protein